ncbi:MAG TPA: hypothetical protein DEE98_01015 [Elusimicrobia bacterium]|nr:MAG: hypothetical protein A2278_03625 [Elusimicrobia bacterium RIFOXYA12_FULL_49_49]OGS09475.1 MAG: hypothetical protein A2204_03705 [Elusimicrobia bacterium RIFOXYA1_FULL_47_7]OGS11251.1 MAG: hypothetical protein A2386_02005 [Elusimicrobia bacterium RIFOXYB1_FULL_48_9]OGS15648.1 MAG: hypothetical protein A2251_03880 [Elusimicrobia bacterium RIFOXYA2_FULL_47_53]OGS26796.1 MAG: hypothetical protein A2339_07100 [Elusimicrobia bacterium RIFOXYB12_FULL_50_12]OGS30747.1 MAG: hypothetical protein
MEEDIGKTAGTIWNYLNQNGPVKTIKLKSELGISNTAMFMALGWLSRENKIVITESGHSFNISLKSE